MLLPAATVIKRKLTELEVQSSKWTPPHNLCKPTASHSVQMPQATATMDLCVRMTTNATTVATNMTKTEEPLPSSPVMHGAHC